MNSDPAFENEITMSHLDDNTLNEYLDYGLNVRRREEVEKHLASCEQCRRRRDELNFVFSTLNTLEDVSLSTDISERVLTKLEDERQGYRMPAWLALTLLLQAGLAIIILLILWPTTQQLIGKVGQTVPDILAELGQRWTQFRPALYFVDITAGVSEAAESIRPPLLLSTSQWAVFINLALAAWLLGNGMLLRSGSRKQK